MTKLFYFGGGCKRLALSHKGFEGFTLAEVLVTLGIIGVVSALTLPTLISNHQEKVLITQLNVSYNQLSQATRQIVLDKNGGLDNVWGEKPLRGYFELLPKYMKLTEVERPISNYFRRATFDETYSFRIDRAFALPSGAEIAFNNTSLDAVVGGEGAHNQCNIDSSFKIHGGASKGNTYFNACGYFYLDVNGFNKPPNTFEKDVFKFYLVIDDIIPAGMPKDGVWTQTLEQCLNPRDRNSGAGNCTAWVIINKNMDYIHCPDKLGWDKASSCE